MPRTQMDEGKRVTTPGQRHIIERPRLIKILDETSARIILLVAPAGYGKTTLARQWAATQSGVVWCSSSGSLNDPAAMALALVRAAERAGMPSGESVREYLRSRSGSVEISGLVEVVLEYIDRWPRSIWLAIDDYHLVQGGSGGETVFHRLAAGTSVSILLASRRRPAWISARDLLYGDALEIDQQALAMTSDEVAHVLGRTASRLSRIAAAARGWPAVLGLAALAEDRLPDRIPAKLHDFVAQELFGSLTESTRHALLRLAVSPVISNSVVVAVAEDRTADFVEEASTQGFITLTEQDDLAIHPLLLDFLRKRPEYATAAAAAVDPIADALKRDRAWDGLVELSTLHERDDLLISAISDGISDLLQFGRADTLTHWVQRARERALVHPVVSYAESQLALRAGEHTRAFDLASRAASGLDATHPLTSRAWVQAATAAYLADRVDEARKLFRQARSTAATPEDRRDALWRETLCATYLGASDAVGLLAAYEQINEDSVDFRLRVATGHLTTAVSFGGIDDALNRADSVLAAVPASHDPMIRTSFLNAFSTALAINTQFERARVLVTQALDDATTSRVDFARPYYLLTQAVIDVGERRYAAAQATLGTIDGLISRHDDPYIWLSARAVAARLAALDPARSVLDLPEDVDYRVSPPMVGEYLAARGLLSVSRGELNDALDFVSRARTAATVVEVDVLASFVEAVAEVVRAKTNAARELCQVAMSKALSSGNLAALVYAYRVAPALIPLIRALGPVEQDRLLELMVRARDQDLARRMAVMPMAAPGHASSRLSKREVEVLRLVVEGLTNREIGKRLFISDVTVKVHLRHAYEKLGVRSRTQAALRAQAEDLLSDY